jgi:hypothetical protein
LVYPVEAKSAYLQGKGPVAQLVEQGTFNPKVAGSIPARPMQNEKAREHPKRRRSGSERTRNASRAGQRTTNTKVTG